MKKFNREQKIILMTFVILIILGVITFCYFSIISKDDNKSVSYKEDSKLKYSVCLKENNYFDNECLEEEKDYVSTLIDSININFNYSISYSKLVKQDYEYDVVATITAKNVDQSSKILYNKSETLIKNKHVEREDSNSVINETLKINYNKYNDIILNLKRDYVLALDSDLTVTLNLKYRTNSSIFDPIYFEKTMSIVIPLGEQTIDIVNEGNNYSNNDVINVKEEKADNQNNILYILTGIDILILAFIICMMVRVKPKKREYDKQLRKIFKTYDQAIVILNKKPDFEKYEIIEISNFDEMLDARDNLNKPILSYQEKKRKEKCYFMIMNDNQLYLYVLIPED